MNPHTQRVTNMKVFLSGAILFLVVLALFFAYQHFSVKEIQTDSYSALLEAMTKPIDPASISWQTYTNEKFGYTVQYPADWIRDEENDSRYVHLRCDYGTMGEKSFSGLKGFRNPWDHSTGVEIRIESRDADTYIKEFKLKRSQEAYSIDGVKAWKIVGEPEYPSMGIDLDYIHVTKNGVNYVLESPFYPIDKYIIDTFKFVR